MNKPGAGKQALLSGGRLADMLMERCMHPEKNLNNPAQPPNIILILRSETTDSPYNAFCYYLKNSSPPSGAATGNTGRTKTNCTPLRRDPGETKANAFRTGLGGGKQNIEGHGLRRIGIADDPENPYMITLYDQPTQTNHHENSIH